MAMLYIVLVAIIVPKVDADINPVTPHAPYPVSPEALVLHSQLRVADLHGDMLLWRRDPNTRQHRGHMDLPRLREGGVHVQVFSTVTKSPKGQNFDKNSGDGTDRITQLAIAQHWPIRTWSSLKERALYQAERLRKIEARDTAFTIARTGADFETALNDNHLIGILATEGAHPLEGDLANIDVLYDAGFRMVGLQHFFDNRLGGSMHGISEAGLTDFGKDAVKAVIAKGMIIDVAHSSEATVRDVLALTQQPIIVSHGGVRSLCPRTKNRNLPDDLLKQIADRGGLIGIGFFNGAICDITPRGIAASLIASAEILSVDHVALGSDFDGAVETALDASELSAITHELLEQGMAPDDIAKVMGENVITFFQDNLKN